MLLLCATPIGNLGDLTPRVREALTNCDAVYCEDTRRTLTLLNHIGIKKPLVSCYRENERQRAQEVVARLQAGETIVYVSDAGMPGVSDPGEALIAACIEHNLPYSVLPGASAVLMAAVMSGLPAMPFTFFGFFPREKKAQKPLIEQLKRLDHTVIFYESPNRVHATVTALLDGLGDLDAALLRELTKLHEEVVRGSLSELAARYAETAPRGECVLCIHCRATVQENDAPDLETLLRSLLSSGLSVRDAAAEAATACGVPKKEAYAKALEIQSSLT
ncbi:MAG: 16S rRNA (cytidine(1402)-2'-O)-methyltransferase [Firmicutes bacterium HGW-Firmicutes-9]|jgi:16S rRNA (cytidine1402-2'-O)-methyltransferase|nr:MAG: 16S rRNA (cytidine(1402)-2'-O)-methyltransferase [Firmicutes bacterium HGW-Firmicutes-9]